MIFFFFFRRNLFVCILCYRLGRWSNKSLLALPCDERKILLSRLKVRSANCTTISKGFKMEDIKTLAHTSWNCKYHVVFAPKFRRKMFYGEKRGEIGKS